MKHPAPQPQPDAVVAEPDTVGLRGERLTRRTDGRLILDGVSLHPVPGGITGLIGPNGSGKTTLLKLLSGILPATSGVVTLDGVPLTGIKRREIARRVAVVEQQADTQVELTVTEVVRLGRIPHRRAWTPATPEDEAAVRSALSRTRLTDRAEQPWRTLSGGERQRVQIARALAQEPDDLLLDEPTNHLDIQHQLELLDLLAGLGGERPGPTTYIALHDLNLAATYCDRVVVLDRGTVVTAGHPGEVLTEQLIADVYRVRATVHAGGGAERPHIRFLGTLGRTGDDDSPGPST